VEDPRRQHDFGVLRAASVELAEQLVRASRLIVSSLSAVERTPYLGHCVSGETIRRFGWIECLLDSRGIVNVAEFAFKRTRNEVVSRSRVRGAHGWINEAPG
jgi:hypothetical protein